MVSVVIINYNTFNLTCECIRSVLTHTLDIDYEIVLVDNASTEIDASEFLVQFPEIKLIKNDVNGGFANGNNIGITNAIGKYILLLNSDTVLIENSIKKAVEFLESKKEVGIVGCRMIYPDGRIQYTARRFRSIKWEVLDLIRFIPFLMPYKKRAILMLGKYFRHDESIQCDWVSGAFFLLYRELVDKLPGKRLDERFFMYGEDHLWCWQVLQMGLKTFYFAGTTIEHINNGSTNYSKRLSLRNTMLKNELEIMKIRKGKTPYYFLFKAIYITKEYSRTFIFRLIFKFNGRLIG